jgi:hypothetical protein
MATEFEAVFDTLKSVFDKHVAKLNVKADTPTEYTLVGRVPSPLPQHKGQPMYFCAVRLGKAYVAFHLMPLYMDEELTATISPELKKRMQGKTCFNFKTPPGPELLLELRTLTAAGYRAFRRRGWV